ncbi:hypothetical protein FRB90_010677, partial [Tulasnella sp. 427]
DIIVNLNKTTAWTGNSTKAAAENLRQTIESLPVLASSTTQITAEVDVAAGDLYKVLGEVQARLETVSRRFITKNKGLRQKLKQLVAHKDRDGDRQSIDACRNDIKHASDRLQERIDPHRAAISSANIATSTTPHRGQTQQHQPMTSKDNSDREKRLSTAKTTFKVVEALSGALPVVGTYVGAAAKVGSTIVEMIAGMDGNQELASRLEARVTSISEHLEHFKSRSRAVQKGETSKRIQDLQCQLKLVMKEMESIQSQSAVSRAFLSADQGVKIKQYMDAVRTTWEELQ